jgi:hypothetical protein
VGGLVVNQGDLLHGDANGVTNIPPGIATDVADLAAEFVAAERMVLDYVQGPGEKTSQGLAKVQAEFSAAVAKLRARIRSSRQSAEGSRPDTERGRP